MILSGLFYDMQHMFLPIPAKLIYKWQQHAISHSNNLSWLHALRPGPHAGLFGCLLRINRFPGQEGVLLYVSCFTVREKYCNFVAVSGRDVRFR